MSREPVKIAKLLLILFATGTFVILAVPAIREFSAGQADILVWTTPILAWIVGPVALANLLVARANSRVKAWLFLAAEVAAISSTVWLGAIVFSDFSPRNAQNGVALMLLPLGQFLLLASYAAGVFGGASLFRRKNSARVQADR